MPSQVFPVLALATLGGLIHLAALFGLTWLPPTRAKPMRIWLLSTLIPLIAIFAIALRVGEVGWLALGVMIAAVPISFMVWTVLHWGATTTMWRIIRNSDAPLSLVEWQATVSDGRPTSDLIENRLALLGQVRLVRAAVCSQEWSRTLLGDAVVRVTSLFALRKAKAG